MNRLARRLKLFPYDSIPYPSKKRRLDKKVRKSAFKSGGKGRSVFKGPKWRESSNNQYK